MIDLKRILVPVDFSDSAASAIDYGSFLAKAFDAELVLVHVLELPFWSVEMGFGAIPPPMSDEVRPAVLQSLEESAAMPRDKGVAVRCELREGTPFVEIVRFAREAEIDLIVMPTHGRTGIPHVLMGSTAERVVRKAPCPVLVVRGDAPVFQLP